MKRSKNSPGDSGSGTGMESWPWRTDSSETGGQQDHSHSAYSVQCMLAVYCIMYTLYTAVIGHCVITRSHVRSHTNPAAAVKFSRACSVFFFVAPVIARLTAETRKDPT